MIKLYRLMLIVIFSAALSSCATKPESDIVAKIGNEGIPVPEFKFYFLLSQQEYEKEGGTDIWLTTINGVSAEEVAKERALDSIARVKITCKQANSYSIKLTQDDIKKASGMASSYYSLLNKNDLEAIGITESQMLKVMEETILYGKLYNEITKNIEVSQADFDAYYNNYLQETGMSQKDADELDVRGALLHEYTNEFKLDVFMEQYNKWLEETPVTKVQDVWDGIHILPH